MKRMVPGKNDYGPTMKTVPDYYFVISSKYGHLVAITLLDICREVSKPVCNILVHTLLKRDIVKFIDTALKYIPYFEKNTRERLNEIIKEIAYSYMAEKISQLDVSDEIKTKMLKIYNEIFQHGVLLVPLQCLLQAAEGKIKASCKKLLMM